MLQRVNPSLPAVNTRITTFYSYKGGCGRTMALANVATLLAAQGYKVLMMDWDLEAPGLPKYFRKYTEANPIKVQGGLIDLLYGIENNLDIDKYENGYTDQLEELFDTYLNQYVVSFTPVKPAKSRGQNVSHPLYLLPAGNTESDGYATKVQDFKWDLFYDRIPGFFPLFSEYLQRKYDVVLIDSRTGISDAGGICTMLMPDTLVLVFTPNQQSYEGIKEVARKAIAYRNASDDIRPLMVYPLPSRVELNEDQLRTEWEAEYEESFLALMKELYDNQLPYNVTNCLKTMKVRHASSYAYKEKIAALEEDIDSTTGLSVYFNIITDTVIYGKETDEFIYNIEEEELKEEIQKNPSNYWAIHDYAHFLGYKLTDLPRADEQYRKAIEVSRNDVAMLSNYAAFLHIIKKDYIGAESYYQRAIAADPNHANSLGNYAAFLHTIKKDYAGAESYYLRAIEADPNPNYANVLGNYAHFLLLQNRVEEGKTYLEQAFANGPEQSDLLCELWFYRFAHFPEYYEQAEQELRKLLAEGAATPGWNLQGHVDIARANDHPHIAALQEIADLLTKV